MQAAFMVRPGVDAKCPVRWLKGTPCGAVEESTGLLSRSDRIRSRTPVLWWDTVVAVQKQPVCTEQPAFVYGQY